MKTSTNEIPSNQPNYLLRRMKAGGVAAIAAVGLTVAYKDVTNNGGGPNVQSSPYTFQQAEQLPRVPFTAPEGQQGTITAMIEKVNADSITNNDEMNQLVEVVEGEHPGDSDGTVGGEHFEIPVVSPTPIPTDPSNS